MKPCEECGSPLEEGWRLCPHCGRAAPSDENRGVQLAVGDEKPLIGSSPGQEVFVSPRANVGDISQRFAPASDRVSNQSSDRATNQSSDRATNQSSDRATNQAAGTGAAAKGFQDILIGPRVTTGAITQIQNLNIEGMNEEQFNEISVQLNLLLERAGIPGETGPKGKFVVSDAQKTMADAVERKFAQAKHQFERPVGEPEAFLRLGNTERLTGDPGKAVELYESALAIYEHTGDEEGIIVCRNLIGDVLFRSGEWDKALHNFQQALRMAEKRGDKKEMAVSLKNIGRFYFTRGNYDRALLIFLKVLCIKLGGGSNVFKRRKQRTPTNPE